MTKSEQVIKALAEASGVSAKDVGKTLEALAGAIDRLSPGDRLKIPHVGVVSCQSRAARTVTNPRSGEPVFVPADMVRKISLANDIRTRKAQ